MDLSVTNFSHNPAEREMQQNSKDFKIKIAFNQKKIIVKHLNPFKFSHCQQIPPLFFRRDSLTSYRLCNTRPMANVRLKVHSALPPTGPIICCHPSLPPTTDVPHCRHPPWWVVAVVDAGGGWHQWWLAVVGGSSQCLNEYSNIFLQILIFVFDSGQF